MKKYDAEEALETLETPTLMFHRNKDEVVSIEDTRRFHDELRAEKELYEFEGEGHVFSEKADQRVLKKTAKWFSEFFLE